MVLLDKCDGGQCVECEGDYHCSSNQYCKNKDLPYILNKCTNKKSNGQLCLQDRVSRSQAVYGYPYITDSLTGISVVLLFIRKIDMLKVTQQAQ